MPWYVRHIGYLHGLPWVILYWVILYGVATWGIVNAIALLCRCLGG